MAWYIALPWIIAQAAPAVEVETGMSGTLKLIAAVAVIAGSFVGGALLARWLRMPDYGAKIGIVLFTFIASVAVCVAGWPPKRGIDLSGGVVLVYEVDRDAASSTAMETAITRINEQLTSDGGEKVNVRPDGEDRIAVEVPAGADVARVEKAVTQVANAPDLKLRNHSKRTEDGKTVLVLLLDPERKAVDMDKLVAAVSKRINPSGVKELTIRQYGAEQLEVIIPEIEEREVDQIKRRISTSGMLEFRIVANEVDDKDLIKQALRSSGRDVYLDGHLAGRWVQAGPQLDIYGATVRPTPNGGREILVRIDPWNVGGSYLSRAWSDYGDKGLGVHFSLDTVGGEKFGQLTGHNLPDTAIGFSRRLGIILDNAMLSAPNIESTIHGQGQISGHFTQDDVDFLVGVLNAGSLPASLRSEPISQQRISSQLGDDTIRMGTESIAISTGAILLFMLVYYRFCGFVADVAVVLNMLVTVALMILIKAAFTLPGLAGLVLTVGMAVDANVLIYERMREETERGASLRMAIRNGFSRAMATIIDSHVTTLVSGAVLYLVGTDQIKGFAVTLIIGLLMSLFTAVFVARVLFDIAERNRWLTKLNMMHLIKHTNIDFIRWRTPAIAASVIISVIGLVAAGMRGTELFDIDFTGGSSVQVVFKAPHDIAAVRKAVETLPDVAVSSVGEHGEEFKVDTSEHDIKKVQALLQEEFGDALQTYTMTYGPVAMIDAKSVKADADGAKPAESGPALSQESTEAKPADKPATEPQPKADEPAKPAEPEAKPAEPAAKPAEPEAKPDSSRVMRRDGALQLAAVGDRPALEALALAQDQPAADKPAEEKPAEEKPAEAAKPAADADKPAEEKPKADAATKAAPAPQGPGGDGALNDEFVGGSRVELKFPGEISYLPLRELIETEIKRAKLEDVRFELRNPNYHAGSDARFEEWTLETSINVEQTEQLVKAVQTDMAKTPIFPSSNQIGGKVAGDTQAKALYAILASMAIIVIYVWIRFQNVIFGLAAVLALVHDVFITIAFLALSSYLSPYLGFMMVDPFKISLAVLAALLTIVGFSINDTIVVFDRIREVRGKSPELTPEIINQSVNQTMSRTLLTSGTVLIASVILYFLGGPGIHGFAYSMVVGVIAGTFSSIYIAAPVLLWMKKPASAGVKQGSGMSTSAARSAAGNG